MSAFHPSSRVARVGIVGGGFMGSVHAQLLAQHPRFDLVAVADPATALAQQFAVQGFTSIKKAQSIQQTK